MFVGTSNTDPWNQPLCPLELGDSLVSPLSPAMRSWLVAGPHLCDRTCPWSCTHTYELQRNLELGHAWTTYALSVRRTPAVLCGTRIHPKVFAFDHRNTGRSTIKDWVDWDGLGWSPLSEQPPVTVPRVPVCCWDKGIGHHHKAQGKNSQRLVSERSQTFTH